jgi:MFS family permease
MRKASLGTLFLTVLLDLLGFGLVVPFLPGVARQLGASDFVATAVAAAFSVMQFLFIPLWGRLSDRVGRRPVLLWSIGASIFGMGLLAFASSLPMLILARLWSGIATANIAVAQAYIADVTTPETRARGMGLLGMGFGLGFIIGPFVGGELSRLHVLGHEGAAAALLAAGLAVVNLVLAFATLPESLTPERRGHGRARAFLLDLEGLREIGRFPGVRVAILIGFLTVFFFSGLEVTFRLFTMDAFGMSVVQTGRLFGFVGIVAVIVQGGLIHRLSRVLGEVRLVRAGLVLGALGFFLDGLSPSVGPWFLYLASAVVAFGNGMYTPSLSSYVSRQAGAEAQGLTLGVQQSLGALARVVGPLTGGLIYETFGMRGPYYVGAVGMLAAAVIALRLPPLRARGPAPPA